MSTPSSMSNLYSEFPSWDGGNLPNIPPFTKAFWHNDTCPKYAWREGDTEFILFVDYEGHWNREDPEQGRLSLYVDGQCQPTLVAETWDELRMRANDWYAKFVGTTPDRDSIHETGQVTPIGQLLFMVCQKAEELVSPEKEFKVLIDRTTVLEFTIAATDLKQAQERAVDASARGNWTQGVRYVTNGAVSSLHGVQAPTEREKALEDALTNLVLNNHGKHSGNGLSLVNTRNLEEAQAILKGANKVSNPAPSEPAPSERDGKFEKALREVMRVESRAKDPFWHMVKKESFDEAFTLLMEVDKK